MIAFRFILILLFCFSRAQSSESSLVPKSATFYVLDRITGKVEHLTIPIGKKVQVGPLLISAAYSYMVDRPGTPAYSTFVQVWDTRDSPPKLIHSSWMRVGCQDLGHPFEHPNFSIWLKSCDIKGLPEETHPRPESK